MEASMVARCVKYLDRARITDEHQKTFTSKIDTQAPFFCYFPKKSILKLTQDILLE